MNARQGTATILRLIAIVLATIGALQSCSLSDVATEVSPLQDPYTGTYWTITDVYLDSNVSAEVTAHTDIAPEAEWLLRFNPPTGNHGKTIEIAYYCAWFYSEYDYDSSLLHLTGSRVSDVGDCLPDDAPPVDYPQVRTFLAHRLNDGDDYTVEALGDNRISILSPTGEGFFASRTDPFERTWAQ